MHDIEPYANWLKYYDPASDPDSPFFGKEYNYDLYSENIYGYFIDPGWDFFGSETLYMKVLYVNYDAGYVIIELLGEWNDALNNDIMHLKRNIMEHYLFQDVNKFILIGENILNFHGSDDSYYEEWFDEVEEGWIVALNFRDFVEQEMAVFQIDQYINFGGQLQVVNWRTLTPMALYALIDQLLQRRLPA